MAATKTKKKKTDNKKMMHALQNIMPLLLIGLGVLLIRRRDALNQVFMPIGTKLFQLERIHQTRNTAD